MTAKVIRALFRPTVSDHALCAGSLALGRLASWWIRDAGRERIRQLPGLFDLLQEPVIEAGEFVALFRTVANSDVVAPAFGIPLRWERRERADERLPQGLNALERGARESIVAHATREHANAWKLCLGTHCPDLSWIEPHEFSCESAGAIVYATLRCALRGVTPAQRRTASATIGTYGLTAVDGLEAKFDAAKRLGIETIYTAPTQPEPKAQTAPKRQALSGNGLEAQLEALAGELDAPPWDADYEVRLAWYNRSKSADRADFYARSLLPQLADRLRTQFTGCDVDTLVVAAGEQAEPVLLAATLFRARRVVLLYETENRSVKLCQAHFSSNPPPDGFHSIRISYRDHPIDLSTTLGPFVAERGGVGVDITAGPKNLAVELDRWVQTAFPTRSQVTYTLRGADGNGARIGENDRVIFLKRRNDDAPSPTLRA